MIFSYQPQTQRTSPIYVLWYSFCGKLYATNGDDEEEGRNGTEALFSLCIPQTNVIVGDRIFSDCNTAQVLSLHYIDEKIRIQGHWALHCPGSRKGISCQISTQRPVFSSHTVSSPDTGRYTDIFFFFINPELCSRVDGNTGSIIKL